MNSHWTITRETHEKAICIRKDGELQYPNIALLDNGNILYSKDRIQLMIKWTIDNMEYGDTITIGLTL